MNPRCDYCVKELGDDYIRCEQCNAPYCNKECRKADSEKHNIYCKPKPETKHWTALNNFLGLTSTTKLPKMGNKAVLFLPGPIPEPVPASLYEIESNEAARKLKADTGANKTAYYVINYEDSYRVLLRQLNRKQQDVLFYLLK
jgi:hypothetical protein